MNRPPELVNFATPGTPNWRRWWSALLLLWGVQSAVLLTLWPDNQPRVWLWAWSMLLPLLWGLVLALRMLPWQLRLYEISVYERVHATALRRWWGHRALGLPVQEVLLLGPVGIAQADFHRLMAGAPLPEPVTAKDSDRALLRCPLGMNSPFERGVGLARQLAHSALTLPEFAQRWPTVRALCWAGDAQSESAFVQTLASKGLDTPKVRMPLQNLTDLDALISDFNQHCDRVDDWLLCAGVVSVDGAECQGIAGEAGFIWLVSHHGTMLLHRGETLSSAQADEPAALCAQIQRYGGLSAPPADCLAMDVPSGRAFVAGDWSATKHQLFGKWGALAHLGPFVGMSLALLQAGASREACGWLSQDAELNSAIGVAMPHDHH
jgi:hypothetical protein